MPQKRNHDFTERYPSIKAGTCQTQDHDQLCSLGRDECVPGPREAKETPGGQPNLPGSA